MRTVPLGDLVSIKGGGTPDRENAAYWGGGIPWASVKDFRSTDLADTQESITELGLFNSASNLIPAGAIIVPTRMAVGKAAINSTTMAINQDLKALQPSSDVDRRYLLHHLLASADELERRATGATVKGITLDVLRELPIRLPPVAEQRRIAAILDEADALRAKRRAALAQLDEMALALFMDMFVYDERTSSAWPQVEIGSLALSMRTGPFGSQLLHSEFVDSGIAVLGIDNAVTNTFAWDQRRFITERKYRELSRFKVNPRDIIVTIMGTCGRAAIVPSDIPLAITTKHLCSITLDQERCLPEYLHAAILMHPGVLRQLGVSARGAVMPGLNMGLIRGTVLSLPPISLQREFANRRAEIEATQVMARESMGTLDSLFTSLQHRAFRGEL